MKNENWWGWILPWAGNGKNKAGQGKQLGEEGEEGEAEEELGGAVSHPRTEASNSIFVTRRNFVHSLRLEDVLEQLRRLENKQARLTAQELQLLKQLTASNDEDLFVFFEEYVMQSAEKGQPSDKTWNALLRFARAAKGMAGRHGVRAERESENKHQPANTDGKHVTPRWAQAGSAATAKHTNKNPRSGLERMSRIEGGGVLPYASLEEGTGKYCMIGTVPSIYEGSTHPIRYALPTRCPVPVAAPSMPRTSHSRWLCDARY
eukprot:3122402-Rhodomonas_salina.3